MGILGRAQALRAVALACGLAWFGPATGLVAATPETVGTVAAPETDQPFGRSVAAVPAGALQDKWLSLARKLDDERVQIALCDGDRDRCASSAALQFLAIVDSARLREGRARFGETNRAVNLAIRAMSDLAQYGEVDVWSSPLVTFERGAGDCEDYAIAKFMALRQAGIAAENLRIVIMRDTIYGEDHAVAAARLDGHWLMLDNRRMAMVEDINVRNYRPLFVIDESGIMKYSDTPLLAHGPDLQSAPAMTPVPASAPGLMAASE